MSSPSITSISSSIISSITTSAPKEISLTERIPIGFNGQIPIYSTEGLGPLEIDMTPADILRRDKAMNQTITLTPNDTFFPKVTFKVSELVQELQTKLPLFLKTTPGQCWLKGSWTNENITHPRDVDISIFVTDLYWENPVYTILADFIKSKVIGSRSTPKWLPLSAYFTAIPISEKGSRKISFKIYKAQGIDLTVFYKPVRFSVGLADGSWFKCTENTKRLSTGRKFATRIDLFKKAQFLVDNHLNDIEEPQTIYNLHLRYLLDLTRNATVVNKDAAKAFLDSVYQEPSFEIFAKKWIGSQEDHYKHNASRVLEFLNFLSFHCYNNYGSRFIVNAWRIASFKQNIMGMEELTEIISKFPHLAPHILAVVRGILLINGCNAYKFDFNKLESRRPCIALDIFGETNYLTLPDTQNSPFQIGLNLLTSLATLQEFSKRFKDIPSHNHLKFLSGIFHYLGINDKLVRKYSSGYLNNQLALFFSGKKADEMQQQFGPYPKAIDFLSYLPKDYQKVKPKEPEVQISRDPFFQPLMLDDPFAKPQPLRLEEKESKEQQAELDPKEKEIIAVTPLTPEEDADHLAQKYNIIALKEAVALIKSIKNSDKSKEQDTKLLFVNLEALMKKSEEIIGNKEIETHIGQNYYKEFLGKSISKILEKPLGTPEFFDFASKLYMFASNKECFSDEQEHSIVSILINSWSLIYPAIGTPLYENGCNLFYHAFQKNLIGDGPIFNTAFDALAASRNPLHLRIAYSKLNQIMSGDNDLHTVERMITLLNNTVLTNNRELFRPLFKTLVNMHKRKHASFELLMKGIGTTLIPGIIGAVHSIIPTVKYNGDEVLLFETLLCLHETNLSPTSIKIALVTFDTLIKHKITVRKTKPIKTTLRQLEREGLILKELLKLGAPFKNSGFLDWADELMRDRWFNIAIQLNTPEQHTSDYDFAELSRFRTLGLELCTIFLASSEKDEEWQKKVRDVMPKTFVVKKIEAEAHSASIIKIIQSSKLLIEVLSGETIKNRISKAAELSLKLLENIESFRKEELTKDLHGMLIERECKNNCVNSFRPLFHLSIFLHTKLRIVIARFSTLL